MFERYTLEALQAIFCARFEASHYRSPELDTEHLVLGLIRKDREFARSPGISDLGDALRNALQARSAGAPAVSTSQDMPVSEECQRVLAHAAEEADRLNHARIGCEHMLMGILREEACTTASMLRERGIALEDLRQRTGAKPPSGPLPAALNGPDVSYSLAGFFQHARRGGIPFTTAALHALTLAEREFRDSGASELQIEHLLIGALESDRAHAHLYLPDGASIEQIREELPVRSAQIQAEEDEMKFALFMPAEECEQTMDFALEEAKSLKQEKIGPEHLILGMLRVETSTAAQLLRKHGASAEQLRAELAKGGSAPSEGRDVPPGPER